MNLCYFQPVNYPLNKYVDIDGRRRPFRRLSGLYQDLHDWVDTRIEFRWDVSSWNEGL